MKHRDMKEVSNGERKEQEERMERKRRAKGREVAEKEREDGERSCRLGEG